jgi:UDP-galactopyranose mutase
VRIVILAQAHRTRRRLPPERIGHNDWDIYEASDHVGGLAASHRDAAGFTYDIGGHVLFSHYPYFTDVFDRLMGEDVTVLQRESWIRMMERYVPYPFQNNIRHLPPEVTLECLSGLIKAQRELDPFAAQDFESWIFAQFGEGIARHFMLPYNFKVWAHPPAMMSKRWIAERVSVIDVDQLLGNVVLGRDELSGAEQHLQVPALRGREASMNASGHSSATIFTSAGARPPWIRPENGAVR